MLNEVVARQVEEVRRNPDLPSAVAAAYRLRAGQIEDLKALLSTFQVGHVLDAGDLVELNEVVATLDETHVALAP